MWKREGEQCFPVQLAVSSHPLHCPRPRPRCAEWVATYSSPEYLALPDSAEGVLDQTAKGEPYGEQGGQACRAPGAFPTFWYGGSELLPQGRCGAAPPAREELCKCWSGTGSSHPKESWQL